MARSLIGLLIFLFFLGQATAWSYTQYFSPTSSAPWLGSTRTDWVEVIPTGLISVISTTVTTEKDTLSVGVGRYVTINVTLTKATITANGSACLAYECRTSTENGIGTKVYAPVVLTNPPSCTRTSVSYTTSSSIYPVRIENFPGILAQANKTGSNGVALFVTTYITTVGYNLGGQPIISTSCSIWLKADAVAENPEPGYTDSSYLAECVDPRRYLCTKTMPGGYPPPPTCGTDWIGIYGQPTAITTSSRTNAGGGDQPGGAAARNGLPPWSFTFVTLTMTLSLLL
ncbi:hypothetical protein TWF281_002418 [Arthrobotrys megalospora]